MEIYESARKHGISDEDIQHGVEHAAVVADDVEESDRAGNLLEIVSVLREDDTEIVIHAMRMRRIYEPLLRNVGESDG